MLWFGKLPATHQHAIALALRVFMASVRSARDGYRLLKNSTNPAGAHYFRQPFQYTAPTSFQRQVDRVH
jgi:hypothetical protein